MGSFGIQMGTIKARKPLVSLLFFVRENIINIVINIVINNIKRKSLILRLWITPRLMYCCCIFFFLEDSEASARPVALSKSPLKPFAIFERTSYQQRYEILCERLMLERDYTSTALVFSSKNGAAIRDGGPNVTAYAFFKSLYLHLASRI